MMDRLRRSSPGLAKLTTFDFAIRTHNVMRDMIALDPDRAEVVDDLQYRLPELSGMSDLEVVRHVKERALGAIQCMRKQPSDGTPSRNE